MFFEYMKMTKDLSAKFYQNNKERLRKKLAIDIKVSIKKKKENDK